MILLYKKNVKEKKKRTYKYFNKSLLIEQEEKEKKL